MKMRKASIQQTSVLKSLDVRPLLIAAVACSATPCEEYEAAHDADLLKNRAVPTSVQLLDGGFPESAVPMRMTATVDGRTDGRGPA